MQKNRLVPTALRLLAFASIFVVSASMPAYAIEYFPLPQGYHWWASGGGGIAEGPDGNLWVSGLDSGTTGASAPAVARVTPAGAVTVYPLPAGYFWWPSQDVSPYPESGGGGGGITAGPDGAMWFTGAGVNNGFGSDVAVVGRIATDGAITLFPHIVGWSSTSNGGIVAGPDGRLWFTGLTFSDTQDGVGSTTTGGVMDFHPLPDDGHWSAGRSGIAVGSDGNLWISGVVGAVLKMTTAAAFTSYALPAGTSIDLSGSAIAAGADGNLWVSGLYQGLPVSAASLARVTTAGSFTLYSLPSGQHWSLAANAIAAGPDGNLWFAGMEDVAAPYRASFARIATDGSLAAFPLKPSLPWTGAGANRGIATDADGNLWFTGIEGRLGKLHLDAVAAPCDDDEPCTADSGDAQTGCTSLWQPVDPPSCFAAGQAKLKIADPTSTLQEPKLTWLWQKGDAVDLADFGSPASAGTWGLCVWDNYDSTPHLVADVRIDAASSSSSASWRDLGAKGWSYRDRSGLPSGALAMTLKPGADGRSLVKVSAGGPALELSAARDPATYLRLAPSAIVQLVSGDGTCWSSEFLPSDVTSASAVGIKATAK